MTRWMRDAACKGMNPDVFFPHDMGKPLYTEALEACDGCPVIVECREHALDTGDVLGVRGGLRPKQLATMARARRKASRGRAVA